ncbi:6-phosphogluconolactonase [Novosphingobium barchaimii LL02]|uniref:6-phosphogluconolactonase n=1 Tax=Novosphingobium barchaimii LL02 TaxID=1114963 RepID=A0A0J7XRR9_9SPHN|nr:6-phosphogluconolactonase [Novosphingobium barchaimii]KMS54364.1 6-phosphogluconolactonase [Novosphingobium barchaimii LL02]
MPRIEMIEGADDGAIAAWFAQRLRATLAMSPEIAVTVPGGSTPFPIFDRLAKEALPWPRISVWPGDDRIVEEDHPASNVGKIRARLEPAGACIVPLAQDAQPPRFAIAWLGMGGDGHVASLFPNTDPRANDPQAVRRLTPDPLPPEAPFDRLSLTIPSLVNSDEIVFVIRGTDKRAVFDAAAKGENDLPVARLLKAARHKVTCFC